MPRLTIRHALERCSRFGVKPGLDAIGAVCAAMGDPQDALRVVHVAGTNGKGAVCALVDSALRAAGFRTGRYTSPHLVSLNERFCIDGVPVSDDALEAAFARIPEAVLPGLTYFELLTATAFGLYRDAGVDYVVLETGLGGRLDATNVVKRPVACAITRIGLDHCDWLGSTIAEIAAEKGGIIKEGVPVALGAMPDEARAVLERIAVERGAPCTYAPEATDARDVPDGLALGGLFNRENAVTAMAVLGTLGVGREAMERGFASVSWPGRYQRVEFGGKTLLVDGAHNPPAMRALVDSLKAERAFGNFAVCGFCGDKDVAANLATLREVTATGFAVPIRNPRSLAPERTAELMREAGFHDVEACATLGDALERAPSGAVVCGSLFLAREALEMMGAGFGGFTPNETFPAGEG
jgi:dihydrofolate synthase/folylpolyglutamate synthase